MFTGACRGRRLEMSKDKSSVTPAVRALRDAGVEFSEHPYKYEDRGGTAVSARELKVDEHAVVKTLVMEDEDKKPLIILMHGDREVSTKELARIAGVKRIIPCTPDTAHKHTGYMVGGTSPFGTRKSLPVYMEETILTLPKIYINGGKRGYLVGLDPNELVRVLKPVTVKVGIER
jgi:Cys-tRNA(Pro) deacylase